MYDDVSYKIDCIPIETEEEFYKQGGKDYNSFLEWVDDERKEILDKFNKSFFKSFSDFCIHVWISENYEM